MPNASRSNSNTGSKLRVCWRIVDSTLILATDQSHVALLSPGVAPRILHLPVISIAVITSQFVSGVSAVTDEQNSVVELTATITDDDSTSVMLEDRFICFNGNGDWLLVQSLHQIIISVSNSHSTLDSASSDANITTR